MNPLLIETALAEFMADILAEASITDVPSVSASTLEELEPFAPSIIFRAEVEHIAGDLYTAEVSAGVSTPSLTGTRVRHSSLASFLEDSLKSRRVDLREAIEEHVQGACLHDAWLAAGRTEHGDGRWNTVFPLRLGLQATSGVLLVEFGWDWIELTPDDPDTVTV